MGQIQNPPGSSSGGGGGTVAVGLLRAAVALAAGATNNLNPHAAVPAWPTNYGRLILTAPSGVANVTGLVAGADGQWLWIFNNDGANAVTLNSQNAGSSAANRFSYFADLVLSPKVGVVAIYDATIARWLL